MKQEKNNEMDLLLRRLGRRDDAALPEDHLEADELNAYAENALPAAARARYTVHLAECSRCRSLVTQLSSAAGVLAASDTATVSGPSGFRKFLASLFTPMVLRYAAPALGLILVAVIGFVVLRRDRANEYVAQDTHVQPLPSASPTENIVYSYNDSSSNTAPSQGRVDEQRKEKNQPAQPAQAPNVPPVVSSVEEDIPKDKAAAQPKPQEQATAASEPPPPKSEPSATPEQSPRAAETETAKNEVRVQSAPASQARKAARDAQREDKDDLARERKTADTGAARAGSNMQIDGLADTKADSRTVAGRHFRKRGGVWIDTAYDSSKESMTIARGSEHYRALVADEPAIKTIADQLDGEIIVVWKGHTYRIR
ncbi:MAG TPA: zf-HC2 domain-containing protein [Pyrinomonadaceae bacterium]